MFHRLLVQPVLAALLLTTSAFAAAHAQKSHQTRDVTLVEVDVANGRSAMVYRRAGTADDREVIALSPQATADDLSQALRVLDALQERFGDAPERDMAAAVRSERAPQRGDADAEAWRRQHGQLVSALRRADRRPVAGFGTVKTIKIKVPGRKSGKE